MEMFKRLLGFVLVISVIFVSVTTARADDYHYTNLLIGDRATGMGGAYTAISDDATGLYYNPAGIVYSTGRSLSASVNAYYDNEKTYKNVIGGNGWSRRSSSLLPNYFGVVQPMGKLKFGFSYAVPDSILEDQSQTFTGLQLSSTIQPYNKNPDGTNATITSYIINFNNENNIYEFGPSLATQLSDNFSTGLTLYYYQKKNLWILNQIIKTSNGGSETTNQYYHQNEKGVRPLLGFMWSPVNNLSLGLSVSKIMLLTSNTSIQTSYQRKGIGVLDSTTNTVVYDSESLPDGPSGTTGKKKYPTQISLGAAWFASQSLLITTDLNYFTKVNEQDFELDNGQVFQLPTTEAVTNLALGTEYYFTKNWAVRGGLFTNYANTPAVQEGATNQSEHIDLYGGTLSISNFTRNTAVTLGTGLTYGSGKAQIIGGSMSNQTLDQQGWMIFLSSSYSY